MCSPPAKQGRVTDTATGSSPLTLIMLMLLLLLLLLLHHPHPLATACSKVASDSSISLNVSKINAIFQICLKNDCFSEDENFDIVYFFEFTNVLCSFRHVLSTLGK